MRGGFPHQRLGEFDEVCVVRVGLVQLKHGELGVVLRGDAFVAKAAVDLVDAVQAAHQQSFQIQFRRDSQIQVQVQRIVIRCERPGDRTAGDGMHHRCLYLGKAQRIEELANEPHRARSNPEHPAGFPAHQQVHVTAPQLELPIGDAAPLLRQGPQRLHEQPQFFHPNRKLPGAGLEQVPGGADDVSNVPALEGLVDFGRDPVALDKQLDSPRPVLNVAEARLAHDPLAHHPAGHGHPHRLRLERLRGVARKFRLQGIRQRIPPEVVWVGVAGVAQAAQLLAPFGDQPILRGATVCRGFIHRLLQALFQAFLQKCVDGAIQYRARVAAFNPGAKILDPGLIQNVGANLASPADIGLALLQ